MATECVIRLGRCTTSTCAGCLLCHHFRLHHVCDTVRNPGYAAAPDGFRGMIVEQLFRTRITEMFGIRLPILAGGLQWLADATYVAAAARAGILGFITAASFGDAQALRQEIRKCRDLSAGRPFGVNISMLPKIASDDRVNAIVDVVAEEGVRFVETSGRSPEAYLPRLKSAGVLVIHKVPAVRYGLKAQAVGVDAVAVVGNECAGHPGPDAVGTFVQAALAARRLSVPFVVGGGVGSGAHLVAALALGADGVLVGTRFLMADEIGSHPDYKRRLMAAGETDTTTILSSLRNTMRVLRNDTARRIEQLERAGAAPETFLPLASGRLSQEAYRSGDTEQGALSVGQAVAFANRGEPLAAIVEGIENEARQALLRLRSLSPEFP